MAPPSILTRHMFLPYDMPIFTQGWLLVDGDVKMVDVEGESDAVACGVGLGWWQE